MSASPSQPKDGARRTGSEVTEALRSRSNSCRLLGGRWVPRTSRVAYKPRSRVPSQYGYDESLVPTSAKPTSRMVSPKCIAAPITTPRLNSTPRLVPSRWCRCRDDVRVWCLWSIRAKSPGSRRSPTRSTSRMLAVPGQGSPAGGVLRCLCNMERVTENEPHPRPAHDSARGARGPASTADQH